MLIKCELCGNDQLVKNDGYYVCEECGTRYTPEEARRLVVKNVDTVSDDSIENWRILGLRAYEKPDYDTAEKYFTKILEKDPFDCQAVHYVGLFKAVNEIPDTNNAVRLLEENITEATSFIDDTELDPEEEFRARMDVIIQNIQEGLRVIRFGSERNHPVSWDREYFLYVSAFVAGYKSELVGESEGFPKLVKDVLYSGCKEIEDNHKDAFRRNNINKWSVKMKEYFSQYLEEDKPGLFGKLFKK